LISDGLRTAPPRRGAYSALPELQARFWGRGGEVIETGRKGEGMGIEGNGREERRDARKDTPKQLRILDTGLCCPTVAPIVVGLRYISLF